MTSSDTESSGHDEHVTQPDIIVLPNKDMKQFKIQLTSDGLLHEDTTIYESDFNIIMRYDHYEEEKVDEIESHLVIQYSKTTAKLHLLDLYFYDKSKTKEYRYWIKFQSLESIQNEIDHDKSFSTLKLVFDQGKEYTLKNCPIEIVSWLSKFLLSL